MSKTKSAKHSSHFREAEEEYFSENDDWGSQAEESQNEDEENKENGEEKKAKPVKIRNVVRKPQPKLDANRLCGERGLKNLAELFASFKPKGENHEFRDLDVIVSKYEYWAHRLFPKMKFVDVIERLEKLGEKREVKHSLHQIRLGEQQHQETQNEPDTMLEDEMRSAKLMEMMNNMHDSDHGESGDESAYNQLLNNFKKNATKISDDDEEEAECGNHSAKKREAAAAAEEEEDDDDDDELFNRLVSQNLI